jgi:hypothetical protein
VRFISKISIEALMTVTHKEISLKESGTILIQFSSAKLPVPTKFSEVLIKLAINN